MKNFIAPYKEFQIRVFLLHLAVLLSLIYIDFGYFLLSILMFVFVGPLLQLIMHEYISHEYIEPKNPTITCLLLILFYSIVFAGTHSSIRTKRNFHITHHRHWKDADQDPTQLKLGKTNIWLYVFGFNRPIEFTIEEATNSILENNAILNFIDRHSKILNYTINLFFLIILPFEWFVTIFIYLPWLLLIVANIHDVLFHGPVENKKDSNWYLLFFSSQAWHLYHHNNYRTYYFGPSHIKYFNLAYYYQKILFKNTNHSLK
jgi:hypothetical protein